MQQTSGITATKLCSLLVPGIASADSAIWQLIAGHASVSSETGYPVSGLTVSKSATRQPEPDYAVADSAIKCPATVYASAKPATGYPLSGQTSAKSPIH